MANVERSFILSNLQQFLGEEKAVEIFDDIIGKSGITDKNDFSLEETKKLADSLLEKGGFAEFVGRSILVKINTLNILKKKV